VSQNVSRELDRSELIAERFLSYCNRMQPLATGVSYLDLKLQGRPGIVASLVLHDKGGVAIIDPGPSSTLPALRDALGAAGIALDDVNALLLTHIHLDHAGATGTLVREHPSLKVYVHENGARHLANPERLLASASRLYGSAMDRLWGAVEPVPPAAMTVLKGGERLREGGRVMEVAFTPGHASHHVSYFNADTGIAFVGDTAGVRLRPNGYGLPPTPPPDIDLEAWASSLDTIAGWHPDTLFLTHFGPVAAPAAHLAEFREHLAQTSALVRQSLVEVPSNANDAEPDSNREAWFKERIMLELRRQMGEEEARAYEVAARFDLNWRGLARYWRKKEPGIDGPTPTR